MHRSSALFSQAAVLLAISSGLTAAHAEPSSGPAATQTVSTAPTQKVEGLWVWKPKYISDVAEQDKLFAFCQRQGFNRLLVQIPWKAGTAQIVHPKPGEQPTTGTAIHPEIEYPTQLARLISEATRNHIVVEALDGAPSMGDEDHRAETLATVDAILDFNRSVAPESRFSGIHWDIEPYIRPEFKVQANRAPIEIAFLNLLAQTRQKLHDAGSPMTLAVDIPMWYDSRNKPDDNFIVTYNGETQNFHMFIQDLTDYIGIMSYRRKALGTNSAFEQTENEIAYAAKIGKVACPAFETTQIKDTPQISFFGLDANTLQDQRHQLEDSLKDNPGFGGMFIHQYPAVTVILEPDHPAD